jgi:hypothetical protein
MALFFIIFIFISSLLLLLTILYLYRNEIKENGLLFFLNTYQEINEDEPIREMGIKGFITKSELDPDSSSISRLMIASSSKNSKPINEKVEKPKPPSSEDFNIKLIKESIELLYHYLGECNDRLKHFEHSNITNNAITSKLAADTIIFTRKLVQELYKREEFIKKEYKLENPDYKKIYKEITSPITFVKDTLHSLISSEDIPPILWDDLGMVLKNAMSILDSSIDERKRLAR